MSLALVWTAAVNSFLATYVHDLSPVIFELSETIKLRWYGLSYVAGFIVGYWILLRLSRRKLWVVEEEKVSDVVAMVGFFGVFLGGRLGYIFFYMIPREGWGAITEDPLIILKVWDGGMSSHGGILGIMLFTLYYARKHKLSWTGLGDGLCIVAPLGILFGRIANFINGELYGIKTSGDAWYAVKFPASLWEEEDIDQLGYAMNEAAMVNDEVGQLMRESDRITPQLFDRVVEISRQDPAVLQALGNHIAPRHPSQLYEGFLEGGLLFVILYSLRVFIPKLTHGIITGLFFILYAVFRILVENVRDPDADRIGIFTKGQFYSIFMIFIGIGFLVWSMRQKRHE